MKTVNQAILKCNKKAWQDIQKIQSATNMVGMESLIYEALSKTFGIWNEGILICQMRRLGQMGEIESTVRIHRTNWDRYVGEVRRYLIGFIPNRMHNSLMYMRMTEQAPMPGYWEPRI